ncbi:hypothetical protein T265_00403 [Opisthorchis viverrini]|uniref:Uncharacterized protein n=1 Tax=Opisthorchis viverrini TaxID=6198 RepID=A0A075ACP7_OPIVI|nr:hypothetical protein T265_00403 [Opisthorchis viverrini]KER33715.1 hypothetical protein T265_00403 [Opisthorchis viverrini]
MSPKKGETGRGLSKSFQQPSIRNAHLTNVSKGFEPATFSIEVTRDQSAVPSPLTQRNIDCTISSLIIKRSAVAPFWCLAAMPPEGSTRAGILPGCPSLDRRSRVAEVGFEPRTFRSVNSRSDHLGHLAPINHKRTNNTKDNRLTAAPFQCLDDMPTQEGARARNLSGYPSLDRISRVADVGSESRTFRSVSWRLKD